jgi:hypothetical protein
MTTIARLIFLSVLLSFFSAPLLADGLPPSQEDVCDSLQLPGATPGLYGLCNAYCEAKDCDAYPEGEEPRSCNQLLANYERKADASELPMPCLAEEDPTCPCWTPEQFAAGGMGLSANFCINDGPNPPEAVDLVNYDDGANMVQFAGGIGGHPDFFNQNGCEYLDTMLEILNQELTTPEETQVCRDQVDAIREADFGAVACFELP